CPTHRAVFQLRASHQRTRETHNRSEEHTSELQSLAYLVCRLLLEKNKTDIDTAGQRHHRLPQPKNTATSRVRCACVSLCVFVCRALVPSACLFLPLFFFLNDAAPPEISPLPLPDALPS